MSTILHIYGPFSIQAFGLIIVIGLCLFTIFLQKDPRSKKLFLQEQLSSILLFAAAAGITGGRLLYVFENYDQMDSLWQTLHIWEGGFSILGTVLAIITFLPLYLQKLKIPVVPFFDVVAIYAPLMQSISRIGCFVAGCCYGKPTQVAWATIYRHKDCLAPLNCYLHPTQLYSSIMLLFVFLFMYFIVSKLYIKTGQLISTYLMCISVERFTNDFWRADRSFFTNFQIFGKLSIHQCIALFIFIIASLLFLHISFLGNKNKNK